MPITSALRLPSAPRSIQKGSSLKALLDREAVDCLAHNLALAHPEFDAGSFRRAALVGLEPLGILDRGQHLAQALRGHLSQPFRSVVSVTRLGGSDSGAIARLL